MLKEAQNLKNLLSPVDYYYPYHARSHLERELDSLLTEALDPDHKELVSFQKRINKYRGHLFSFLYHPDVPPDNKGSERAIRNVKVKQKISGQLKVFNSAENFAILRSIIDTTIKKEQKVLSALSVIANYSCD